MDIDDEKHAYRSNLLRSPAMLAFGALAGCATLMLFLIKGTLAATVSSIAVSPMASPSVPALHAAIHSFALDTRLAFALLSCSIILMAGVSFALSRRSLRDALKAGRKRLR